MKASPSPNKPPLKPQIGPNVKLIRNLFIIGGLLFAISVTWEIRRETRAKRERENRQTVEKQALSREKAQAEAKALSEERKREAELAAAKIKRESVKPPEFKPPVEVPENTVDNSKPKAQIPPPDHNPGPELPPEIASLKTKARDLVLSAARKRDEQLAENSRKLSWDLDLHLRTLAKSEQVYWMPHINRIKSMVKNNRITASILQSGQVEFSKKMEEVTTFAITKQKQIDQGFIAESAKIHGAYTRKISDAAKTAQTAGQKPLAALLGKTLDDAAHLGAWLRSLGVNDTAEP